MLLISLDIFINANHGFSLTDIGYSLSNWSCHNTHVEHPKIDQIQNSILTVKTATAKGAVGEFWLSLL